MKVLIADDSKLQRELLKSALLPSGYEVVEASTGEEAHSVFCSEDSVPICLLDWQMPLLSGIELAKIIRSKGNSPYRYLILVTASVTKENLQEGFSAGVDDFIRKPFDPYEVLARVRAGERVVKLEEELRTAVGALRFQANHDGLTGLLNRNAIMQGLQTEFERARRTGTELSIVLGDIDHFKNINDTFGHPAGDKVIQSVAHTIRASIRSYDLAGRYGGEEFLMVLPSCSVSTAHERIDQLRVAVELASKKENYPGTTMSFGVCGMDSSVETAAELVNIADSLLYTAKRSGRNRVESIGVSREIPGGHPSFVGLSSFAS